MKHRLKLAGCLALLLSVAVVPSARADVAAEVLKAQTQRVEVIRKARAATICIFGRGGRGGGSGVVISPDGYALTNFHVTSRRGNGMKCGMADGKLYDAVIVGIDPTGDVALIKLFGRDDFPAAEMADSDARAGRRLVLRRRQSVPAGHRLSAHGHATASSPACTAISTRPARCWNTPTASRPTPRSTPATPAGRCSTPRAS